MFVVAKVSETPTVKGPLHCFARTQSISMFVKGPQQDLKFEVKIKKQNWLKMRPKGPQQDLKFEVKIKKQFS